MSGPSPAVLYGLVKSQLFFHPPPVTSSFADQTVMVTGGNAGLGREAIRQLLELRAEKIIIACRNTGKGETAKEELMSQSQSKTVIEVWQLDMASYASVVAFGQRVKSLVRLDAVLENAGMWPTGKSMAEGHEETLTTNVISTFLLAYLLLPKLQESAERYKTTTRLCFVGSRLHKFGYLHARKDTAHQNIFDAVDAQPVATTPECDGRYHDSKLLLQIYAQRLAILYQKKHGDGVCIMVVNPGYCLSALKPPKDFQTRMIQRVLARSTEEGGRAYLHAIALDKVAGRHGMTLDDGDICPPAAWISTADGQQTSDRIWADLNGILDAVVPGLTTSL